MALWGRRYGIIIYIWHGGTEQWVGKTPWSPLNFGPIHHTVQKYPGSSHCNRDNRQLFAMGTIPACYISACCRKKQNFEIKMRSSHKGGEAACRRQGLGDPATPKPPVQLISPAPFLVLTVKKIEISILKQYFLLVEYLCSYEWPIGVKTAFNCGIL